MRRSITIRLVGVLAATAAALGTFGGVASANGNHGLNGYESTNSIYNSPVGGTCNAAYHNDGHSNSFTSNYNGYPSICFG